MTVADESFQKDFEKALKEASLPTDAVRLIGRKYRIEHAGDWRRTVLVGTVTAIEFAWEQVPLLVFYVSSPTLFGYRLEYVCYVPEKGWLAITDPKQSNLGRTDKVEFVLL